MSECRVVDWAWQNLVQSGSRPTARLAALPLPRVALCSEAVDRDEVHARSVFGEYNTNERSARRVAGIESDARINRIPHHLQRTRVLYNRLSSRLFSSLLISSVLCALLPVSLGVVCERKKARRRWGNKKRTNYTSLDPIRPRHYRLSPTTTTTTTTTLLITLDYGENGQREGDGKEAIEREEGGGGRWWLLQGGPNLSMSPWRIRVNGNDDDPDRRRLHSYLLLRILRILRTLRTLRQRNTGRLDRPLLLLLLTVAIVIVIERTSRCALQRDVRHIRHRSLGRGRTVLLFPPAATPPPRPPPPTTTTTTTTAPFCRMVVVAHHALLHEAYSPPRALTRPKDVHVRSPTIRTVSPADMARRGFPPHLYRSHNSRDCRDHYSHHRLGHQGRPTIPTSEKGIKMRPRLEGEARPFEERRASLLISSRRLCHHHPLPLPQRHLPGPPRGRLHRLPIRTLPTALSSTRTPPLQDDMGPH